MAELDERDRKIVEAMLEMATATRSLPVILKEHIEALREIATELRILRFTLGGAISPELRDNEGHKTREGSLRTEEMPGKPKT
jgi:hypothetical protein